MPQQSSKHLTRSPLYNRVATSSVELAASDELYMRIAFHGMRFSGNFSVAKLQLSMYSGFASAER
jgi:hypothetical protein